MSMVNDVAEYIRQGETSSEDLGLEIEHFILDDKGMPIDFHTVSDLIRETADRIGAELIFMDGFPFGYQTGEYSVTLEPSCQFEISISPYSDLDKIKADPDEIPLSPKKRYKYMDAYFRNTGNYGRYMMRASSSTQVSVDFKSEEDLVRKLSVLQKISPVLMAMMENKTDAGSTLKGHEDKPHLLRIQEWDDLDDSRTGFFPGSFDSDFGYEKAAEAICSTPLILLTDEGETYDVSSSSALDLIED